MREENNCAFSFQEKYFLDTFPLIRQIAGRQLRSLNANVVDDIIQTVALRLWKWKTKDEKRTLSAEEWRRYANVATQNEIKRYYSRIYGNEIFLSDDKADKADSIIDGFYELSGNTEAETVSFSKYIWTIINNFSTRQKYALLFKRQDFIFELVTHRCCTIKDVADSLELSKEEFIALAEKFPLSDEDIKELLKSKTGDEVTIKQIWKARGKAIAKLVVRLKDSG